MVGAAAYHQRVVTIWAGFSRWFADQRFPRRVSAVSDTRGPGRQASSGGIDAAWNTNLACIRVRERTDGACVAIAMRDNDRDWTSQIVVCRDGETGLDALRGKRVGFADHDSAQPSILPSHAVTGELAQLEPLRNRDLDFCVVSHPTLESLGDDAADITIAWTTPPFHHRNLTTLTTQSHDHERFSALLGVMPPADPALTEPIGFEWVDHWADVDKSGYADLIEAVRDFG